MGLQAYRRHHQGLKDIVQCRAVDGHPTEQCGEQLPNRENALTEAGMSGRKSAAYQHAARKRVVFLKTNSSNHLKAVKES